MRVWERSHGLTVPFSHTQSSPVVGFHVGSISRVQHSALDYDCRRTGGGKPWQCAQRLQDGSVDWDVIQ
jgi:hypothetical protein